MRFLFLLLAPCLLHAEVSASSGEHADKIVLRWNAVSNAASYRVERIFDAPQITVKGKNVPHSPVMLTQIKAAQYTDLPAPPGRQKYIITALDTNQNPLSVKEVFGWRQLSDKEFFLEFQKGIDSSLPRIRTMKMLNFFGEKVEGWRGGNLVYRTTGIFRRPIRIIISYTNFIDQYLTLNGTYEVQIFKVIGQRGKLVGTIHVDGIYKGSITHDLVIERGASTNGGIYRVQQQGKTAVDLPWNVTSHPLDDSQYEKNLKTTMKEAKESD